MNVGIILVFTKLCSYKSYCFYVFKIMNIKSYYLVRYRLSNKTLKKTRRLPELNPSIVV